MSERHAVMSLILTDADGMLPLMAKLRPRRHNRALVPVCLVLCAALPACSSSDDPVEGSGGSSGESGSAGAATAGGSNSAAGSSSSAGVSGAAPGAGTGGSATAGAGGSTTAGAGGGSPGARTAEATCARWKADTADLAEGTWSGSVDSCTAGDISAQGRDNALRMFNLIRWLADLPAVTTEEQRNQQAQACALMMTANDQLSHEPPMSWKCYSALGAEGAGTSNISSGPGVTSVLLYMVDNGNETTFGHRRIILSNELGPIGLGSAGRNGSSCMQNIGGKGKAGKAWMAWPPPGPFPIQANEDSWSSLDDTGWSIQSKGIDLSAAKVSITSGGQARPVRVEQLTGNYGNAKAIRIVPQGWQAEVGETYAVSVTGVSPAIAYEIEMIDCE